MKITPIQLAKRIEKWGKTLATLGVAHFEFDVTICDNVPPEDSTNNNAAVWISESYDVVCFYFDSEYLKIATEDQLDQTIVHEWMHVAMRDFDNVHELAQTWMPEATYTQWEQTLKHEREGVVDRLARLVIQLDRGRKPRFSP